MPSNSRFLALGFPYLGYIISHYVSTLWNGMEMKTVTDFTFLDSEITADGDRSHKIKRYLVLGRKAMTNIAY